MEPTDEFRERALSAAVPVFLVILGVVVFAVLLVTTLFAPLPAVVAWPLLAAGVGALVVGLGLAGGFRGSRGSRGSRGGAP